MTRKATILGLAALGILAADAARALPDGWYTLGADIPYKCHANYVADGSVTPIATYHYLRSAEDIRTCQRLCDSTAGCVAFSFERHVSGSPPTPYTRCVLLGRGPTPTERFDAGRFEWAAICYRTNPFDKYLEIDWRSRLHLDQDHLRPGLPGSGVPHGPNKP